MVSAIQFLQSALRTRGSAMTLTAFVATGTADADLPPGQYRVALA